MADVHCRIRRSGSVLQWRLAAFQSRRNQLTGFNLALDTPWKACIVGSGVSLIHDVVVIEALRPRIRPKVAGMRKCAESLRELSRALPAARRPRYVPRDKHQPGKRPRRRFQPVWPPRPRARDLAFAP